MVNWNGGPVLDRCLRALAAQTRRDFEIILIDNGSTDGSADDLETRWPDVRVERLEGNRGFAAANNLGAQLAHGRWLALLNTDAFPAADWLEHLLRAAEAHPEFSFFASCLAQADRPNDLDGAGDVYHVSGVAWRRAHGKPVPAGPRQPTEVFGACAAAALYQREAFLEANGFDEDFFTYHEDVDLAFRLRLRGYRCLYVPEAVVEHVGSGSHGAHSDFVLYHSQRNLVWTFFKNMPTPLFWWNLPGHVLANMLFTLYYTVRGQGRVMWRAKRDAASGLSAMWRKRREIQRTRVVPLTAITRVLDHGWLSPYLGSRGRREGA